MNVNEIEIPLYQRDLVYVSQGDGLSKEDVEAVIHEGRSESVDEWISDAQWESARQMADELLEDVEHTDDEHSELMYRIVESDTSTPYEDLLRGTGHMLFRCSPDEDDMAWLSDELDSPEATLEALGLGAEFLPVVTEILPEIAGYKWEGGGCFGATFVFSCSPADLWLHQRVTITDPFLWLTNPWSGNGYGVVAKGCTITRDLADIHVDSQAWGYGADAVFGGLLVDDSEITEVSDEGS